MTLDRMQPALATGFERLAAWSDLLDDINVYPVADADTGRNLVVSLAPLHRVESDPADAVPRLLVSATGNSGNIACGFFAGFLAANPAADLHAAIRAGRDRSRRAVADPMPGTMLTVLDELLGWFDRSPALRQPGFPGLIQALERAVHGTADTLPALKAAGVVDSGALGLFLFLEGFFNRLSDRGFEFRPVTEMFRGKVRLPEGYAAADSPGGCCVDTVVRLAPMGALPDTLPGMGGSLVVQQAQDRLKIHIHTAQPAALRRELERAGRVERWSEESLQARGAGAPPQAAVQVVTDAAGSITREEAAELGITLLPSYILLGGRSLPETLLAPDELYRSMRAGVKVTTAQASVFERHQSYQSVLGRCDRALYLCVGSVYTGNHAVAAAWKRDHDPDDRLTVIDTGVASGRLGIAARATARFARGTDDPEQVIRFARSALLRSEEYIFLERLHYLAAGGRLSKTRGFLGDMFQVKPVITPTPEGAQKVGTARTRRDQLAFATARLDCGLARDAGGSILLEHSDNRDWVAEAVLPVVRSRYPQAEVVLSPLSLTSGAHMGPGTWGVAFLPAGPDPANDSRAAGYRPGGAEADRHART
jgi:DegV family protein with EDD domain